MWRKRRRLPKRQILDQVNSEIVQLADQARLEHVEQQYLEMEQEQLENLMADPRFYGPDIDSEWD